jgi:hypothetical protein
MSPRDRIAPRGGGCRGRGGGASDASAFVGERPNPALFARRRHGGVPTADLCKAGYARLSGRGRNLLRKIHRCRA